MRALDKQRHRLGTTAMKHGTRTTVICPEAGCRERLVYQESVTDAKILALGGVIVIPIERHFYRCSKHGLFRYHSGVSSLQSSKRGDHHALVVSDSFGKVRLPCKGALACRAAGTATGAGFHMGVIRF
jgi:hypothetical protein